MKLLFLGDIYATDELKLSSNFKKVVNDVDYVIYNLEGPVCSEHCDKITKIGPHLRNSAKVLDLFGEKGVANLANNHILDYSVNGLQQTIGILEEKKRLYFGAGTSLKKACKPLLLTKDNEKIVIYGQAEDELNIAGERSAGVANISVPQQEYPHTAQFAYLHGGNEFNPYMNPFQLAVTKEFLNKGFDAVFWAHSHCTTDLLVNDGKLVSASLGNSSFANFDIETHDSWLKQFIKKIILLSRYESWKRASQSVGYGVLVDTKINNKNIFIISGSGGLLELEKTSCGTSISCSDINSTHSLKMWRAFLVFSNRWMLGKTVGRSAQLNYLVSVNQSHGIAKKQISISYSLFRLHMIVSFFWKKKPNKRSKP